MRKMIFTSCFGLCHGINTKHLHSAASRPGEMKIKTNYVTKCKRERDSCATPSERPVLKLLIAADVAEKNATSSSSLSSLVTDVW